VISGLGRVSKRLPKKQAHLEGTIPEAPGDLWPQQGLKKAKGYQRSRLTWRARSPRLQVISGLGRASKRLPKKQAHLKNTITEALGDLWPRQGRKKTTKEAGSPGEHDP
jgi:hypothetical protein